MPRYLEVSVEEIYEEEEAKQINNFENNTNSNNIGTVSGNYYCNIPEFLLENQRDYIEHLKKENERLQEEIKALQNK